jgi:hypothetical protein
MPTGAVQWPGATLPIRPISNKAPRVDCTGSPGLVADSADGFLSAVYRGQSDASEGFTGAGRANRHEPVEVTVG